MTILSFIGLLALITLYFYDREKMDKSLEDGKMRSKEQDLQAPYILRKREFFSQNTYFKYNFKSLEEAKIDALKSLKKSDLGFLKYEMAELWYMDNLIETFITNEREPIEKIRGFNFNKYTGSIKPESYKPFDPKSIGNYNYIEIRLTNGDNVRFTNPKYSLRTNCIMGKFGAEFSPCNQEKSSLFNVIPIRIIDSIVNSCS